MPACGRTGVDVDADVDVDAADIAGAADIVAAVAVAVEAVVGVAWAVAHLDTAEEDSEIAAAAVVVE